MNPSSPFSLGLTLFWDMVTWYLWVKYLLTLTTKVDTEFIISLWWIQTPWWRRHQESACSGDLGLIPGLGRTPEERNAVHSSILAWRIPWTEEPGGLQYMGSQRVRHDWATKKKKFGGYSKWFIKSSLPNSGSVGLKFYLLLAWWRMTTQLRLKVSLNSMLSTQ